MPQTAINIRMDEHLKNDFSDLMNELGLSMSAAFTVFAKTAVREGIIHFAIGLERPNKETETAFAEAEELLSNANTHYYESADELFRAKGWKK